MRLTPEEKASFRQEGLDPARRADFLMLESIPTSSMPINDYIRFLQDIQTAFGPLNVSREIPETRFNKI
jgi:hypothetical protein